MTARAVTWIDGIQVSAQDMRLLSAALVTSDGALSARSGVRPGGANDLAVTALGTPNMSVNVAAGQAFIDGTEAFAQGLFVVANDGTVNLAIAAADSTNPRRDLIVARVYGESVLLASRRFALEVVTGSPAASPTDPATPANSIVLARVAVAAGATSIGSGVITDLRAFTAAVGGVVPCVSTARPAAPYIGMVIFETDSKVLRIWDGTVWTTAAATSKTDSGDDNAPSTGYTDLSNPCQVTVGPGRWTFIVKGYFNFSAATAQTYSARLLSGATQADEVTARGDVSGRIPFSLLYQDDITSTTTIKVQGKVSGVTGTQLVSSAVIVAIPG